VVHKGGVTRAMSRLWSLWNAPAQWGKFVHPCNERAVCTVVSGRSWIRRPVLFVYFDFTAQAQFCVLDRFHIQKRFSSVSSISKNLLVFCAETLGMTVVNMFYKCSFRYIQSPWEISLKVLWKSFILDIHEKMSLWSINSFLY